LGEVEGLTDVQTSTKACKRLERRDYMSEVVHELTKEVLIIVTDGVDKRPWEEMVKRHRTEELRCRVKQMPVHSAVLGVRSQDGLSVARRVTRRAESRRA